MAKETKGGQCILKENVSRCSVGAAGHLGRSWIYLTIPIFHFGFMCMRIWKPGWGIMPSPRMCGWAPSPRDPVELPQLGSRLAPLSPESSELCGYFLSFSSHIFLLEARVFPFPRKAQMPSPRLHLGPRGQCPPSFIPGPPGHLLFSDSMEGEEELCSVSPHWRATFSPHRWLLSLFLNCLQGRGFHELFWNLFHWLTAFTSGISLWYLT